MKIDFSQYNDRVKGWGKAANQEMKGEGTAMGIRHRAFSVSDVATRRQLSSSNSPDDSLKRMRVAFKEQGGTVQVVAFKVRRSLIFSHMGAGRGRGGQVGSKWNDSTGNVKRTKPSSFGKMGTAGRKAKPFIARVLDKPTGVDELAFIAADELGSGIINSFAKAK